MRAIKIHLPVATVIFIKLVVFVYCHYVEPTGIEKRETKGKRTRVRQDKSTQILLLLIDGIGA